MNKEKIRKTCLKCHKKSARLVDMDGYRFIGCGNCGASYPAPKVINNAIQEQP